MLRNILLSGAAIAALSTTAFAADLPSRKAPPVEPYVAAPIFTWTGFYIGANAGASFGGNRGIDASGAFLAPANAAFLPFAQIPRQDNNVGFTGGVTIGYNYQFSNVVFGFEGDANYLSRGTNASFSRAGIPAAPFGFGAPPNTLAVTRNNSDGDFFATARLRLGYSFDRALFYVTGGAAFRGNNNSNNYVVTYTNAGGATIASFADRGGSNNNNIGYTVGGGIEYAFNNNWSMKAEYLYSSFSGGNRALTDPANPAFSYTVRNRDDFSIARAGLNYKFGGPASSVVARY
jgi:outer membrane immunogenic protein